MSIRHTHAPTTTCTQRPDVCGLSRRTPSKALPKKTKDLQQNPETTPPRWVSDFFHVARLSALPRRTRAPRALAGFFSGTVYRHDGRGKFTKMRAFYPFRTANNGPPKGTAARRAPLGALSGEMSSRDNKTHCEAKFKQKRAICPFKSTNNDPS